MFILLKSAILIHKSVGVKAEAVLPVLALQQGHIQAVDHHVGGNGNAIDCDWLRAGVPHAQRDNVATPQDLVENSFGVGHLCSVSNAW